MSEPVIIVGKPKKIIETWGDKSKEAPILYVRGECESCGKTMETCKLRALLHGAEIEKVNRFLSVHKCDQYMEKK